jgi:hypothetical protein
MLTLAGWLAGWLAIEHIKHKISRRRSISVMGALPGLTDFAKGAS